MSSVYFARLDKSCKREMCNVSEKLIKRLNKETSFEKEIPLKVHFGEEGNETFVRAENYEGLIRFFKKNKINSKFIETNVLYKGRRTTVKEHKKLALEHGFVQLPIMISNKEDVVNINLNHFNKFKIAREFNRYKQIMVVSHFKGHFLAGFGGAVKQLGMGFATRSGKNEIHSSSKPFLNPLKCKKCGVCVSHCPKSAIEIDRIIPRINKGCIGCAACIAVCPNNAMTVNWIFGLGSSFNERLVEYAYASQKDKKHIYVNFLINITRGCDCVGGKMKIVAPNIGVLASLDPVAVDQASLDLLKKHKRFRGEYTLKYAESIGLGNRVYELIEI
ncbi:MAG: DUF362 domain-containing protein [Candidatus Nanoarchaeia archaeon]